MTDILTYPFDANLLLRKKHSLRRALLGKSNYIDKRIAILGGSTTSELKEMLELFLLNGGIRPAFYESAYNQYYQDVMFNVELKEFNPDVIYVHTSNVNISHYPNFGESNEEIKALLEYEIDRFRRMWDRIVSEYACPIIQNNFELPHYRVLGNLDFYDLHGRSHFVTELNRHFSEQARQRQSLYINDINYLSAWFGLERWYDKRFWYSYKYAMSYEAIPHVADSVASIIKAIYGLAKKCLVVDLDNTLWGGIVGDDGALGIKIGKETAESEAYTEFQCYLKWLKTRGVLLSTCSKNDEANAKEGFSHPDSILKLDDFSAFYANWEPKNENIRKIASSLNIGMDALVFADDNPVERDIVRSQTPLVSVPELGSDITKYINILDKSGYFETVSLSFDDLQRSTFYVDNVLRLENQSQFECYDDFILSLKMSAEIKPFSPIYLDRITQLVNKTNQFNLTTKRYTFAEIENIANSNFHISLYGRLRDKFGDNGLVSVSIGAIKGHELHIDLWLMSCRVLKRGMEAAMLDQLVTEACRHGIKTIYGYYFRTTKNGIVKDLYKDMGFQNIEMDANENSVWILDISGEYTNKNQFIEVKNDS